MLNKSIDIIMILLVAATAIQARQIRFNRFGKEVVIDIRNETSVGDVEPQVNTTQPEIQATVRELRPTPTPYPAAGYRPSRAFDLPAEQDADALITTTTTTNSPEFLSTIIPTTANYDLMTTTITPTTETLITTTEIEPPAEIYNDDSNKPIKAPYPPAGYRPDRAFKLPNEERETVESTTPPPPSQSTSQKGAPYPAAGYRPRTAFNLPNEIQSASLLALDGPIIVDDVGATKNNSKTTTTAPSKIDSTEPKPEQETTEKSINNSKNPVCGVSLTPLRPRPATDAEENPDAERVFVPGVVIDTSNNAPTAMLAQLELAQPLLAQPFLIPARAMGNYAYSAQFRTW